MLHRKLIVAVLFASSGAQAHDFWLQPLKWNAPVSEPFELSLLVGHGPSRQRSPIAKSRIIRFEAIDGRGRRADLRNRLHLNGAKGDATLAFRQPGSCLLVLETDTRAESHLSAIRFNDYLQTEGLTPALELRSRLGRMGMDGSENYSRHAKAIVVIGGGAPLDAALTRPVGMALEIVPERNPLARRGARGLPVRIYYHGAPLAGALVKLTDLSNDAEPVEMRRSDRTGRAVFTMPTTGSWLVNVIWTRPEGRDGATDFETDFSSLSFNLAQGR